MFTLDATFPNEGQIRGELAAAWAVYREAHDEYTAARRAAGKSGGKRPRTAARERKLQARAALAGRLGVRRAKAFGDLARLLLAIRLLQKRQAMPPVLKRFMAMCDVGDDSWLQKWLAGKERPATPWTATKSSSRCSILRELTARVAADDLLVKETWRLPHADGYVDVDVAISSLQSWIRSGEYARSDWYSHSTQGLVIARRLRR